MKAFINTTETKEQALAAAKYHRDADMLIKGTYGTGQGNAFKACSVGCAYQPFQKDFEIDIHAISEPVHGIPEWLTRVRDTIFEGLPEPKNIQWHYDFVEVIPVGADLDSVKPAFLVIVLQSALTTFDHEKFPDVKKAIEGSIVLWQRDDIGSAAWLASESAAWLASESAAWLASESAAWSAELAAWLAAKSAARSAKSAAWAAESAESAAWLAAESAAKSAAWSAESAKLAAKSAARSAKSAAWAAESAAWLAAESAAKSAARSAKYEYFAEKLLDLMRNAPISE